MSGTCRARPLNWPRPRPSTTSPRTRWSATAGRSVVDAEVTGSGSCMAAERVEEAEPLVTGELTGGRQSFCVDDLVELRPEAERGFLIVYRVSAICADGALQLERGSVFGGVTVAADDIDAEVFRARPIAVAAAAARAARGEDREMLRG